MPEYVYGLHDFHPENEDEVGFHAGDRIMVIEKDELYEDGWWKGRNPAGQEGLFPVGYTTPSPPETNGADYSESGLTMPTLQPLQEEPETESPTLRSPVPRPPSVPSFLNGHGEENSSEAPQEANGDVSHSRKPSASDGEVMRATMTDVQKAIEQLGRDGSGADDYDGARSFSFASTKEGGDTETDDTDFDLSDLDGSFQQGDKGDWHKNARRNLAAKAKRAVENAKQLEAMMEGSPSASRRAVAPPIDVEMSDESEVEDDDFTKSSRLQRAHPGILEEDENALEDPSAPSQVPPAAETQNLVEVPPEDESQIPTASANVQAFTVPLVPPTTPSTSFDEMTPYSEAQEESLGSAKNSYPTPTSLVEPTVPVMDSHPVVEEPKRSSYSLPSNDLPPSGQVDQASQSKHSSIVSSRSAPLPTSQMQTRQLQATGQSISSDSLKQTHPSEWSLEQVIEWLKGRGFDQDICDKFAEQEITGDVLLELDTNVLKTEIGILAYGKRIRIANAIAELRRPLSIEFSDHYGSNNPSPLHTQSLFQGSIAGIAPATHSRSQSQSQSHHSFPLTSSTGTNIKHGHSQSMQSAGGVSIGYFQPQPHVNGDVHSVHNALETTVPSATVGLGIDLTPIQKQPALSPSPSDGALKDSRPPTIQSESNASTIDDRGHLSESEAVPTTSSMRRRIFGRSHDSTASIAKTASKESPLPSPTIRDSDKDSMKGKEKDSPRNSGSFIRSKSKKSEGGKHGDRLSIFGGTFAGPRSKHRKPPPSDEGLPDRSSKFSLPRLQSSIRKSSSASQRALSPVGSLRKDKTNTNSNSPVKDIGNDASKQDQLRKRTVSAHHPVPGFVSGLDPGAFQRENTAGPVTQGRSIMDQIGEPDYAGWMRKKGERYHSWKTRFFVLQGPHMYCLRSSSNTETRLKEYINVQGYRVTVDEGIDPGRYGFRIDHDHDKTHYFSADEKTVIREWMKAIMKATIGRDYTKPVISSCNISTIPLVVAQAMNPAPRPPSPSARDATQRATRRENTSQLSTRDARVLMGLPAEAKDDHARVVSVFDDDSLPKHPISPVSPTRTHTPSRPSREMRNSNSTRTTKGSVTEDVLIEWANTRLPGHMQVLDPAGPLYGGLALLRLAESIKGQPASPPVPDIAFPVDASDGKLDGLVRLFDFLLDNDVKMGSVSINDVRQGKRDKVVQLLKALKSWEEKRKFLSTTGVLPPQGYPPPSLMVPMTMKM